MIFLDFFFFYFQEIIVIILNRNAQTLWTVSILLLSPPTARPFAVLVINPLAPDFFFFFNFNTFCIWNVNNTGTKQVSIMKQTAFWREKTESIEHV